MEFKDLLVKHPYYCSDSNYYSNDASEKYENWEEFISDWDDADVEYNHVFRFDIKENEDYNGIGEGTYYCEIFVILQRKGIFKPIFIAEIKPENFISIKNFLAKHFEEVKKIWQPFSFKLNK